MASHGGHQLRPASACTVHSHFQRTSPTTSSMPELGPEISVAATLADSTLCPAEPVVRDHSQQDGGGRPRQRPLPPSPPTALRTALLALQTAIELHEFILQQVQLLGRFRAELEGAIERMQQMRAQLAAAILF